MRGYACHQTYTRQSVPDFAYDLAGIPISSIASNHENCDFAWFVWWTHSEDGGLRSLLVLLLHEP